MKASSFGFSSVALLAALPAAALCVGCSGAVGNPGGGPGSSGTAGSAGGGPVVSGGGGTSNGVCAPAIAPRVWRLSDEEFSNAVSDLFPGITVPAIVTPGRTLGEFINVAERYPVDGALASSVRTSAESVAADAVKNLPALLNCAAGQADTACVGAFIDKLVPRAFRRPIDATERSALLALYAAGATTSSADGVRLLIDGILQSPSFLYRTELGTTIVPGKPTALTPYELATSLSFLVLDSIPDAELWSKALDGSIAQAPVFTQQATRLLATPKGRANISAIFLKWLGLGAGVTTELDATLYPEYNDSLRQSMLGESTQFLSGLVDQNGTLADLMNSRKTFVDANLAKIYGVPYPAGSTGFIPATLPAERAGILTQAGVLVGKSRGHVIVIRGKFVRRDLFCQNIPSPPPTVNIMQFDGSGTERQQSAKRVADPVCGACHSLMDPLGVTFEKFDALARYKPTAADGTTVDSTGQITGTDVNGPVASPVELAGRLGMSAQAQGCVSQNMLAYALGRELTPDDQCEQTRVSNQVQALGGHLPDLIAALVRSPTFAYRTGGQ
jgi:hypothetical protein